jgi:hypothetical protein
MRKWLILLSTLMITTASGAPAWTWVDDNGQVHFSDRPVPGARQVELTGAQGFGARATPPATPTVTPSALPSRESAQAAYRSIEVTSPTEQQTLWNIGTVLAVELQLEPPLQPGHRVDLIYDGARQNLDTVATSLTLNNVYRGTHTLQAVVIDDAGSEVTRSPPRNFVVQQNSIQNPNSLIRAPRPPKGG